MKIAGENTLHAPVARAWDALLDPAVLVATIPGCEQLVATGENSYDMTVTAGVAAIKGTYAGTCVLSDLSEPSSLVMKLDGAGAPGTIGATVNVGFADGGDGTTRVTWDADAVVGGMIGGVGQRMLTSVSKRMAGEFFGNVDKALSGTLPAAVAPGGGAAGAAVTPPAAGQVFTAPPSTSGLSSQITQPADFVKGIAVGAGLVLLGVVAGSLFGRRR
jgi:carbon monoxide dehydrogenase subunit G